MKPSAFRAKLARKGFAVVAAGLFAAPGFAAPDLTAAELPLSLPATAVVMAARSEPMASYPLPLGPFKAGTIATRAVEGGLQEFAWRLPDTKAATLEVMQSLRGQLVAAGYAVRFECADQACGGFDFRYGIAVLPEPDMHVDLGDYRFLVADRDGTLGKQYLTLLVSRSPLDGYVQMTRIGGLAAAPADLTTSTKSPVLAGLPPAPQDSGDLATDLGSGAPVVLEDLVFASGAALQAGDYPSLAALAAWLQANPDKTVLLVGHTDDSGGLAANISLSRRRAESVRAVLLSSYGIPPTQVAADGVGYLAPRASNLDAAGQMKNRRVEVFLTSTQ